MTYQIVKALHIIGFVSWFAGLFYIVRLFIYHVEATARPEGERKVLVDQLSLMERRLWYAITVPAMLVTLIFGVWLLVMYTESAGFRDGWLHVKLTLVVLLVVYHHVCGHILRALQRGTSRWTSEGLRWWNEVATLLLVATILIAVVRANAMAPWYPISLVVFAALMAVGLTVYKKRRKA